MSESKYLEFKVIMFEFIVSPKIAVCGLIERPDGKATYFVADLVEPNDKISFYDGTDVIAKYIKNDGDNSYSFKSVMIPRDFLHIYREQKLNISKIFDIEKLEASANE